MPYRLFRKEKNSMYQLIYQFLSNHIFNGLNDFTMYSYGWENGAIVTTPISASSFTGFLCSVGSIVGVIIFAFFIYAVCRYLFRLVAGLMTFRG